jgi:hypothetical protein
MVVMITLLLPMLLYQSPCTSTATDRLLPNIIGVATGADPAWLLDGSSGHFSNEPNAPVKTLWIFKTRQRVLVKGRERNTGATTRFQHQGLNGPIGDEMVVEDPRRESVLPGGTTRELLNVYAFIPSYVFYPIQGAISSTSKSAKRHDTSPSRLNELSYAPTQSAFQNNGGLS